MVGHLLALVVIMIGFVSTSVLPGTLLAEDSAARTLSTYRDQLFVVKHVRAA